MGGNLEQLTNKIDTLRKAPELLKKMGRLEETHRRKLRRGENNKEIIQKLQKISKDF